MSGTGYTRQSSATISSGLQITSASVNNEFNQLQAAFSSASGHAHDGGTGGGGQLNTASLLGLTSGSQGMVWANGTSGLGVATITGTASQIDVANGTGIAGNPTISIDAAYVGQTSITTLGTIGTGTWAGTSVAGSHGGTGASNAGVFTYGANNITFTTSGTTSLTLPASGTLLSSTNNLSDVTSASTSAGNLLPTQTSNSGKFLTTNGTGTLSWAAVSGASGGTVTSVTFTGDGVVLSSTPSSAVTGSGTVTATLLNVSPGTVLCNAGTSSTTPGFTPAVVLGNPASTSGTLSLANGGTSGQNVKIQNLGTTSAYNFNLPTAAGSSGQILQSGGGVSSNMSWLTLSGASGIAYSAGAFTLATQTNNTIMSNVSGSTAVPSANTISSVLNILSSVKGVIPYASATSTWGALGIGTTGQVLTVASGLPSWAAPAATGIGAVTAQTFTGNGTYTPTSGTKYAIIEMTGGGGGGSGNWGGSYGQGSGGGAGGYLKALLTSAQLGSSQTVTIGAAGTAGNNSNGGTGGTTSLGSLLSCAGGVGGVQGNEAGAPGGVGGSATVTTGTALHVMQGGQGGGSGANFEINTGQGGSNPLGQGGASQSGSGPGLPGFVGTGYGSGGGGGDSGDAGAVGRAGVIIIIEFQ